MARKRPLRPQRLTRPVASEPIVIGPPQDAPEGPRRYQMFEVAARSALPGGLSPKVEIPGGVTAALAFKALDAAVPLLLLPVRLETRYVLAADPPELRIRIYPDQVHVDSDSFAISRTERDLAIDFWTRWYGEPSGEGRDIAWRTFVRRVGGRRAGHVAQMLRPRSDGAGGLTFPGPLPEIERRAARPVLLPRQWVAVGFTNAEHVFLETSVAVDRDLRTGADPSAGQVTLAGDALSVDEGLAWMIDYERAHQAGMAITVPLTGDAAKAREGLDVLLVVGVDETMTPAAVSGQLSRLLDVHARTEGCAFVPQGTPTNNTETAESAWRPDGPGAARPWDIQLPDERPWPHDIPGSHDPPGPPDSPDTPDAPESPLDDNAARFAAALGLADAGPLRSLAHGRAAEAVASQHMRLVTFEAVMGTMLRELLDVGGANGVTPQTANTIRRWFVDHVTGGAPIPAIRIGPQPYGVLPVRRSSAAPDLSTTAGQVERVISLLIDVWRRSAETIPSLDANVADVAGSGEAESAIASILASEPHPARILLRDYTEFVAGETPFSPQPLYASLLDRMNENVNEGITLTGLVYPPIQSVLYPDGFGSIDDQIDLWNEIAAAMERDLSGPVLEEATDYIDSLLAVLESYERRQRPLRWLGLRRFAGVLGLDEENTTIVAGLLSGAAGEWGRAGVVQAVSPAPGTSARDYLIDLNARVRSRDASGALPATALSRTLSPKPLLYQVLDQTLHLAPNNAEVNGRLAEALDALAGLEAGELEWLLRETLGLGAHRLDAWATSLATERLARLRAARPQGVHAGGFGWVLDLRPRAARRPGEGFIHAPSMAHATTAALLRAGWHAHGTDDPSSPVAVDARSHRVRTASWLLEGVRQGQVLGDLLGYRFERMLHDLHADDQIRPVRQMVLEADGRPNAAPDAPVDGIALLELYRAGTLRGLSAPARQALQDLETAFDAVNDVTLLESVHQLAAGNTARASAMLDAMSLGTIAPPELRAPRTPRSAVAVEHRVVILLDPEAPHPAGPWSSGVRDAVAPELEAWVASVLPSPKDIGFTVVPPGAEPVALSVASLTLSALDAVFLAGNDPETASAPLRTLAAGALAVNGPVEIRPAESAGARVSLADFVLLATEVRAIVEVARPLDARDVRPASAAGDADTDPAAAHAAASALLEEARGLRDRLAAAIENREDVGVLVSRLARLGVSTGDAPADPEAASALLARLDRRIATADRVGDGTPKHERDVVERQLAVLLAGRLPLLGRFMLAGAGGGPVVDVSAGLAGGQEVDDWLDAVGRVRKDVGRLTTIGMLSEALGGRGLSVHAGQHPVAEGERWAATSRPLGAGRVTVTAATAAPPSAPGALASGLLVDAWSEAVPSAEQPTGVAFQYDAPSNRPPQTWLLAMTPDGEPWSLDLVLDTLLETLEWARLRAVGPEDLVDYGRAIPTAFVPGSMTYWREP